MTAELASTNARIERIEAILLRLPQSEGPLVHRFQPGVYLREIRMPANHWVIGHEHLTEHWNIIISGRCVVMIDGVVKRYRAGDVVKSAPGVRKVLFIEEETRWMTIHANPDDTEDLEILEARHVIKSRSFLDHQDKQALLERIEPQPIGDFP